MVNRRFQILFLIIPFFTLITQCNDVKNLSGDRIVIRLADVSITEYELEKNLNRFIADYHNNHKANPDSNAIKKWIQDFTDRTYFLADAYRKGYNKKEEVIKVVESMERLMISQAGGLLEQKLIEEKLVLDDKEIDLAKQRSTKKLYVEYLQFNELDSELRAVGNNIKTAKEFQDLVKRSSQVKSRVYGEDILIWPYMKFWEHEEYLFGLNKGDITPILKFYSGYYMFYIKDIDTIKDNISLEAVRNNLKTQKTEKIRTEFNKEVQQNAMILYNVDILNELEDKLKAIWPIHKFNKSLFNNILQQDAFIYHMKGLEVKVSVSELMDNYNYRPFRQEIANHLQLSNFIQSIVHNEYAYQKAKESGVMQQRGFVLDRENYMKSLVYASYEENELKNKIIVTEEEITGRYNHDKNKYVQPANAVVSIFYFDTQQNADKGMFEVLKHINDSARFIQLNGLQDIEWNKNITYNSSVFSDEVMVRLMHLENKNVSMSCAVNGKYLLFLKKYDYGQRIMQLTEVRDMVKQDLINENLNRVKQQLLVGLKKKYNAAVKIDFKKYNNCFNKN